MVEIKNPLIKKYKRGFVAQCTCGNFRAYSSKNSALRMIERGRCSSCKKDYRNVESKIPIYKVGVKWCKKCSGCMVEQCYTRKDHAKQSFLGDWQCKKCAAKAKSYSCNAATGPFKRIFNKFKKSAYNRNLAWEVTLEDLKELYTGECSLTGWKLSLDYANCNGSIDRIDSSKGYTKANIQWVHVDVNMSKNKLNQDYFVKMCKAVADKVKW